MPLRGHEPEAGNAYAALNHGRADRNQTEPRRTAPARTGRQRDESKTIDCVPKTPPGRASHGSPCGRIGTAIQRGFIVRHLLLYDRQFSVLYALSYHESPIENCRDRRACLHVCKY